MGRLDEEEELDGNVTATGAVVAPLTVRLPVVFEFPGAETE
jgi:hypothetical protein